MVKLEEELEHERKLRKYYQEKSGLRERMGFETNFDRDLSTLRRYIFEKTKPGETPLPGVTNQIINILDAVSSQLDIIQNIPFYLTIDRKNKTSYTSIYPTKEERKNILQILEVTKFLTPELARIPHEAYHTLKKEAIKDNYPINIVEPRLYDRYLAPDRIPGSHIGDFYRMLMSTPGNQRTKEFIVSATVKKLLRDNAFSITRTYELPAKPKIPYHKDKVLEIIAKAREIEGSSFTLSEKQEQELAEWFSVLDETATYPVRDGTPFNYLMHENQEEILLSDKFLRQEQKQSTIKDLVEEGIYAYDLDDFYMRSFPLDEFSRAIDFLMPGIPFIQTNVLAEYFSEMFQSYGGKIRNPNEQLIQGRIFRNLRMAVVCLENPNYSGCDFINTPHCLEMAARAVVQKDLSKNEKNNLSFSSVFYSVMQAYC